MKRQSAALGLSLLVVWLGRAEPIEVRDDLDVLHRLNAAPERVVSLAPNITEMVFALGLGERLVGVSSFCDYPTEAQTLPRVGGFSDPDLERTLALEPELVLLTRVSHEAIRIALDAAGVTVYTVFPQKVGDLGDTLRRLGILLGAEGAGRMLSAELEGRFAAVRKAVADVPEEARVRVFFEVDPQPLMTVTDDSFQGSLIRLAGGRNIAAPLPRSYARIAAEAVIAADPQVIVCAHKRGPAVGERRGWGNLEAVRRGRVHPEIDADLLVRAGPRAAEGAEALLRIFYPELAGAAPSRAAKESAVR